MSHELYELRDPGCQLDVAGTLALIGFKTPPRDIKRMWQRVLMAQLPPSSSATCPRAAPH